MNKELEALKKEYEMLTFMLDLLKDSPQSKQKEEGLNQILDRMNDIKRRIKEITT